jgi:hypothetical protein
LYDGNYGGPYIFIIKMKNKKKIRQGIDRKADFDLIKKTHEEYSKSSH